MLEPQFFLGRVGSISPTSPAPPALDDLWQGHLQRFLACAFLYDRGAAAAFLNRPADTERPPRFRRQFGALFGWTPPHGALEWEALRPVAAGLPCTQPYTRFLPGADVSNAVAGPGQSHEPGEPGESMGPSDSAAPCSFTHLIAGSADGIVHDLLSRRAGVEFLCTGLVSFDEGDLPFDSECRLSLLPHPRGAGEMLLVDALRTDGEMQHPSLAAFFLRRWNPSEVKEWLEEFGSAQDRHRLSFLVDPDHLEGTLRAFEILAREERRSRPFYLNPSVLRHRSFWLYGHAGGDPYPGFARELGSAPAITDWEVETSLFARAPWLTAYWMLAHLYLGNDRAAERTAQMALRSRGEVIAELGRHVLRVLDDPADAGIDAALFSELRETTLMCARPWQLEPDARRRREEVLASLVHLGQAATPDSWPTFLSTL